MVDRRLIETAAALTGLPVEEVQEAAGWVTSAIGEVMALAEMEQNEATMLVIGYVNAEARANHRPHPFTGAEVIAWKLRT